MFLLLKKVKQEKPRKSVITNDPAVSVGYKPLKDWLFYFNYQRSYIPPQFSNIGNFVGTSTDYFQIFNVMEGG
ncbi:hypothetical protein HpEKA9_11500 [Helicobacter pylori]